jgi:anaerobic magnesium-protoporphyrin IX monomethyl ester cyclase
MILLTTLNAKYIHTNLAIRLLYDLNKEFEGLEWKEFTIKEDQQEVSTYCAQYQIVAFSCYIWNITQTLEVCEKIKALNPDTKILLGGPEVSYEWEAVIALNCIDFIITGEGEIPFREFLTNYPKVHAVPSLIRKENGEVFYNPEVRNFDLNNYQGLMPYANEDPESLKNKVLYLETSRGCPYKCEFCLASLDNKVRYLPIETIKETLLFMMQNGKVIKFLDRTFNVKKLFTIDIFQFILDNHRPGNVFQFEITADIIHPDIVAFIREKVPKGLFRFEIGIQTVNQKANLEVQRKQNFNKTKEIVKKLDDLIEMHLDLIVGLPFDYWDDIKYSIEEVFKLFPPELQLGFLKFLKGTPMRDKEEHSFIFDPNPPYQLIESKYLSKEELAKIVQLEHALEIYWNKKRAENTLRYVTERYSVFDFLLNLGIFFGERRAYHQYTLGDVYEILLEFAKNHFPNDLILKQLIALDYYLYYKVRPKPIEGVELSKTETNRWIEIMQFNKEGRRHIALPLLFDAEKWLSTFELSEGEYLLFVEFDGKQKGRSARQLSAGEIKQKLENFSTKI